MEVFTGRVILKKSRDFLNLEDRGHLGDTALLMAARSYILKLAPISRFYEYLISQGADVKAKNDRSGETCLHYILQQVKEVDTLICLIRAGAEVNVADHSGCTPSHVAYSRPKMYRFWASSKSSSMRPHHWESALDTCGYGIEGFRRAFYASLGP